MNKKTNGENKLTAKQTHAIPFIVSSPTYTQGCRRARINKCTLYKWLKIPEFKTELDRHRDEVASEAFGVLTQNVTKAVESLAGLLDNEDDRLKRLAAKDVIDFIIRHKENEDLDRRLTSIEARLAERP